MTDDDLGTQVAALRERAELLLAAYEAAPAKARRAAVLVEYRCRSRRCELATVWQAPGARLVHLPAYKLSRDRTIDRTTDSAREKNTTDGHRRWKPRVIVLDELSEWGPSVALDLNCDHVATHVAARDVLSDTDNAKPGSPVRRFYPL